MVRALARLGQARPPAAVDLRPLDGLVRAVPRFSARRSQLPARQRESLELFRVHGGGHRSVTGGTTWIGQRERVGRLHAPPAETIGGNRSS